MAVPDTLIDQSPRPAPIAYLPFKVIPGSVGMTLQYEETVGLPDGSSRIIPRWFYPGAAGYEPTVKLMEMYRELERQVNGYQKERDEAKAKQAAAEVEQRRLEKYVAELKGKVERTRKS